MSQTDCAVDPENSAYVMQIEEQADADDDEVIVDYKLNATN